MAVECRRQESAKVLGTPVKAPAGPVRSSLVRRISEFASIRLADPMPPLPHDDLTRIRGIGPRIAQRLNLLGVARFDQIAAWTAIDVRRLSVILGLGRIISAQNWIEQAALLSGEASETSPAQAEMTEADGVRNGAPPKTDAVLPRVERDVPQPAPAKIRHVATSLLEALHRVTASAPPTLLCWKRPHEHETQLERGPEHAAMPNSPETMSDIGAVESADHQPVVADTPPPLTSKLPQGTVPLGFELTDESEDAERGLRTIAAFTTMSSLEPDCAGLMMEETGIMAEEADITIIERAPMGLAEEDDAAGVREARVGGSLRARSHRDDEAHQINAAAHAGYYDDLGEATVEIFDLADGDEGDEASESQERAPARRKFFRALTGDGG